MTIKEITDEKSRLEKRLAQLNAVLEAIRSLNCDEPAKMKRALSPEARERISAAQKHRWLKAAIQNAEKESV